MDSHGNPSKDASRRQCSALPGAREEGVGQAAVRLVDVQPEENGRDASEQVGKEQNGAEEAGAPHPPVQHDRAGQGEGHHEERRYHHEEQVVFQGEPEDVALEQEPFKIEQAGPDPGTQPIPPHSGPGERHQAGGEDKDRVEQEGWRHEAGSDGSAQAPKKGFASGEEGRAGAGPAALGPSAKEPDPDDRDPREQRRAGQGVPVVHPPGIAGMGPGQSAAQCPPGGAQTGRA